MKFSSQPTDDTEINLAPIVDVVFLMLIFFVVSTSLTTENRLNLQLPASASTDPASEPLLTLDILANGELRSQGESINDLALWLNQVPQQAQSVTAASTPRVLLRAEADTRHAHVAQVLDAVRAAGFEQVAIATRRAQP